MRNILRRHSFGDQPVDGVLGDAARLKQPDNQTRRHLALHYAFLPGAQGSGARGSRSVTTSTTTVSFAPIASARAEAISPGCSTRMPRPPKLLATVGKWVG